MQGLWRCNHTLSALSYKHTCDSHTHVGILYVLLPLLGWLRESIVRVGKQTRTRSTCTGGRGGCYHVATHSWFLITWNSKQPSHHITGMQARTHKGTMLSVKSSDVLSLWLDAASHLKMPQQSESKCSSLHRSMCICADIIHISNRANCIFLTLYKCICKPKVMIQLQLQGLSKWNDLINELLFGRYEWLQTKESPGRFLELSVSMLRFQTALRFHVCGGKQHLY